MTNETIATIVNQIYNHHITMEQGIEAIRSLKAQEKPTAPADLIAELRDETESRTCEYQEWDTKNCTATECPYSKTRGTDSGGTCFPHCGKIVCPPNKAASYLEEPLAVSELRREVEYWQSQTENPLAVQASFKGFGKIEVLPPLPENNDWEILLEPNDETMTQSHFIATTYAECEAKARAYLEGLDDKGEK